MSGPITAAQSVALGQAAVLLAGWSEVLAPFELELVQSCVDRFRAKGGRMTLTANEWRVVEEAVGGMTAARDDARRQDGDAASAMRGAA